MRVLSGGQWRKGSEIFELAGVSEREIRRVAEDTAGLISGNLGYKRLDKATETEKNRAVASLRSRARKIMRRASLIEDS